MNIVGQHVRRTRWIHARRCVVRVEVDAIIPIEDPSEACFEPQTVHFLKEVSERAEAGDIELLKQVGQVYVPIQAA